MKIIVDNTRNIPFSDINKIAHMSENNININKASLIITKITNKLFNDFNNDIHTYIKIWDDIISYWRLKLNNNAYKKLIKKMWLNPNECAIWVNLYTTEKERKKWYANIIKNKQIKYIKQNYPNIKKIVWWTTDKKILWLYLKYWAIFAYTEHLSNTKIYLYYYNI